MKDNRGVSIITLIVTIIVIIILASLTIYYGIYQNTEEAVDTKNAYEVHEIIEAITNRKLLNELNSNYYKFIGSTEYADISINNNGVVTTYRGNDGWFLVNNVEQFRELGLNNTTGEYLINYIDGEAISVKGIHYKDKTYYSLSELKKDMGGGTTILANAQYDSLKKVNKPVLSKGMVPVKYNGEEDKWFVTTESDEEWYDYSKKLWANVMLMDELEVEGYDNIDVRSVGLAELEGKRVVKEGSSYVWIPRYTATSVGETGSKVIFSNLLNDTKTFDGETYVCPEAFSYEGMELTGIWASKYEASLSE